MRNWLNWNQGDKDKKEDKKREEPQAPPQSQDEGSGGRLTRGSRGSGAGSGFG